MKRVLGYSAVLLLGLVGSRLLPTLRTQTSSYLEFEINTSNLKTYGWAYSESGNVVFPSGEEIW